MADANSAYTLADLATLKTLDQLDLIMIEQPLAAGDLVEHAQLQAHLKTPLCPPKWIGVLDRGDG